jgi:D-sedoheptulose 7-phosphate isomerase
MGSWLSGEIRERERVLSTFLEAEQERIARSCFDMARAFSQGATLIVHGTWPAASDAAHVAVEFMHPVIVGKRALPALALGNDPTGASRLRQLARPGDIGLGLTHGRGQRARAPASDCRPAGRRVLRRSMPGLPHDHPRDRPPRRQALIFPCPRPGTA